MNRAILEQTGRAMLCSIFTRWPEGTRVRLAYEAADDTDMKMVMDEFGKHVKVNSLLSDRELVTFIERSADYPQDALKHAARRFAYKSFAVTREGLLNAGRLIWMDADTLTYRDVNDEALEKWLPIGTAVAFLGRKGGYSECGFVMYDTSMASTRNMLAHWRRLYTTDALYELEQWHDCWAFDISMRRFVPGSQRNNLTPWGRGFQHVFINGPVGAYIDHMKGPRKEGGASRMSDVIPEHCSQHFIDHLRSRE